MPDREALYLKDGLHQNTILHMCVVHEWTAMYDHVCECWERQEASEEHGGTGGVWGKRGMG